MTGKLDPQLQQLVETSSETEREQPVQVIVGLSAPASPSQVDALRKRGLKIRSVIGDVLTGTAPVAKISHIAEDGLVAKIESSGPLYKEKP